MLDANVLVLLIVGLTSRRYIAAHKRLSGYTEDDFDLLVRYVGTRQVLVTPNTITEASNLASQIDKPKRTAILHTLRLLTGEAQEIYVASKLAAQLAAFPRLGITDSVLLSTDFADVELLTADLDLYAAASLAGRTVVNFNHHIEASRP